jgi:hypothetical protein
MEGTDMRRLIQKCPSCGGEMIVTELSCTSCDTVIHGTYTGCTFCDLSDENLRFLELFVASRGNIKEMERETGLGYWTIRGQLDAVIQMLQLNVEAAAPSEDLKAQRRAILESVEHGELSITEAERMLMNLAKKTDLR